MFPKLTRNWILQTLALPVVLSTSLALAQSKPAQPKPAQITRPVAALAGPISDKDLASTQEELIRLLRLSPTLTTVVEHDPSLLSNADYVRRNNPQLAQFLDSHPEIALNPDFYLFTRLKERDGSPDQALERAVWPDLQPTRHDPSTVQWLVEEVGPFVVFVCVLLAALWLFRQFVENRRWGRIFKLQMDVHSKLIDKFGSNEQLLTYMDTEAGKRFLEAAPIPVDFESDQRVPNVVARVLTPLQIGIVLSLLGVGFLSLRHAHRDMDVPMLLMGTVMLMPGTGFILSAGITWVLAGRLGLMPDGSGNGGARNGRSYPLYESRPSDRQDDRLNDRLDTRDRQ
jgi:hypothetical protein